MKGGVIVNRKKMEVFFTKTSFWLERSRVLNEIVQSFVALIPIFMIGAFTLVIQYFPIPAVTDFIANACDGLIYQGLSFLYDATYGVVAIYVLVILSFKYSVSLTKGFSNINIFNVITALASYFIIIGVHKFGGNSGQELKVLLLDYTNERNIFVAVLVALVSTYITIRIYNFINKEQVSVHIKVDFTRSIRALLPMIITMIMFLAVAVMIAEFTPFDNLGGLIKYILNLPFKKLGKTVLSGIGTIVVQGVSWFFGIHGSNTFKDMIAFIFPDGSGEVFSKTFLDIYAMMGGSGSTLGLLIIGIFKTKEKEHRQLMCSALVPGIFNINEIILFGLPIVLNPVFIIPFIMAPVVSFLIAYGATISGLVPVVTNTVNWTTPPIISGYLATNSWRGAALQVVTIIISILVYLPFMKMYVNIQKSLQEAKLAEITEIVKDAEKQNRPVMFSDMSPNLIRVVAKIGMRLREDINNDNIAVHYQPQVSNEEKVVSAEALLRWNGGMEKIIYPPLVVALAKEYKIYEKLTRQIIKKSLDDICRIYKETGEYLPVSVNIDVEQLVNEEFIEWVIGLTKEYKLPENTLGLEITEQANLVETDDFADILKRFRDNGIVVSIDDFSMGYTSLAYLQMNQFDYIKLDGGIVKNMEKNERSKEIVDSLISLGKNLGFKVVAEYVESKQLQNMLQDMGCSKYQGYLYSPAINIDEYIDYIKELNNCEKD